MSPLRFGWPLALLGFVALVGLLWWLQHLRVRHRAVVVPTTRFWQAAVRDTRARVFRKRFRHPWAFAAICAMAGALWFAASDLQVSDAQTDTRTVVLVDASADLRARSAWAQAKQAVTRHVESLQGAAPEVIVWAGRRHAVLAQSEATALLLPRLGAIQPADAASRIDVVLDDLVQASAVPTVWHVWTAQPTLLQDRRRQDTRVIVHDLGARTDPVQIRGLGYADDPDGDWAHVDVTAEVSSPAAPTAAWTLDQQRVTTAAEIEALADKRWRLHLRGMPARGQRLAIRVGDATGVVMLPDRSPIRVQWSDTLPAPLRLALAADPGVVRATSNAEVAVGAPSALPSLVLVQDGNDVPAFAFQQPQADEGPTADAWLARIVAELALDRIDATELATQRGRPIDVVLRPGATRRVEMIGSLVGQTFNLRESRSFPLFLARALRWLANRPVPPAFAEAGTHAGANWPVLSNADSPTPPQRTFRDSPHGAWLPTEDSYESPDGTSIDVMPGVTPSTSESDAVPTEAPQDAGRSWDLPTWLAALALLGLCLEWWFVRRGRMP